jgi:hypothetical protein
MDLVLARLFFVALLSGVCYFLHPFGLSGPMGALGGAVAAGAVIIFELRVRALSLKRLIGAVVGSVLGIFGAALFLPCPAFGAPHELDVGRAADFRSAADDIRRSACGR